MVILALVAALLAISVGVMTKLEPKPINGRSYLTNEWNAPTISHIAVSKLPCEQLSSNHTYLVSRTWPGTIAGCDCSKSTDPEHRVRILATACTDTDI